MSEALYRCLKCQNVFKPPQVCSLTAEGVVNCPACGSPQTEALPAWAPAGSGLAEAENIWEYECQECKHTFKRPVPASPAEAKEVRCPECGGSHLHRSTPVGSQPLYCG